MVKSATPPRFRIAANSDAASPAIRPFSQWPVAQAPASAQTSVAKPKSKSKPKSKAAAAPKAPDHLALGSASYAAYKPEEALRHFQAALAADSLSFEANCRAAMAAADIVRGRPDDKRDPGKYYELDTRNCIHFVGRIAELGGLTVAYPRKMIRKPKQWLNHVTSLNPQLGATPVD